MRNPGDTVPNSRTAPVTAPDAQNHVGSCASSYSDPVPKGRCSYSRGQGR
jgi:hypothetical protein